MAVGLKYGHWDVNTLLRQKEEMMNKYAEFRALFLEKFATNSCKELLGYDCSGKCTACIPMHHSTSKTSRDFIRHLFRNPKSLCEIRQNDLRAIISFYKFFPNHTFFYHFSLSFVILHHFFILTSNQSYFYRLSYRI